MPKAKKWEQIADDLRHEIRTGKYIPGEDFPTNSELREKYNANFKTIQQAVNLLISEGLIDSSGSGKTRRTVYKPPERSTRSCGFLTDAGDKGRQEVLTLQILDNFENIPNAVRKSMSAPVLLFRTRQWKDNIPVAISESYLPNSLPLTEFKKRLADYTVELYALMKEYGFKPSTCRETLVASLSYPEEQILLQLPRPSYRPVVRIKRTVFDLDGNLLEYCLLTDRADCYEFSYEFPLEVEADWDKSTGNNTPLLNIDKRANDIDYLCSLLDTNFIVLTDKNNRPLSSEIKEGFTAYLREKPHSELLNGEREIDFSKTPLAAYREGARAIRPDGIKPELALHMNLSLKLNKLKDKYLKSLENGLDPVFDKLIQFILQNKDSFEKQDWGRFSDDYRTVYVLIAVVDGFLSDIGILNKRNTLCLWKGEGVLQADGDGRHLARPVWIGGRTRRAYALSWPSECFNCKENGIIPEDSLSDLKNGGL